jgi:asparagine synthase (glutamine-hydrolysing)
MGVRPLYYHSNDSFFLVSDSIEVMLAHPDVSREPNDKVIAEFALKGWVFNQWGTFFSSIQKCPRATYLIVMGDSLSEKKYWDIGAIKPLHYESKEEYVEHLQNLLETVIGDRIDSTYPIGAHMSGGLDSSVIATIAGRMWKERGNTEFYTYNWCRPGPDDDPEWHEWGDARKIARIEGFEHTEIDCNAEEIKQTLLHHDIRVDGTTMYEYERVLLPQAQAKGIRLIFSGFGGDEILTARFKDTHIDKIRRGRFISAWRGLRSELDEDRKLNALRLPYRYVRMLLNSILPSHFRHRKLLNLIRNRIQKSALMLTDKFSYYALSNHLETFFHSEESVLKRQLVYINSGYHQERMGSWTALGRKSGVRYVYPYLDKRIVEFALSIPSFLYFKGGHSRYLYKLAATNFLPPFMLDKRKPSEERRVKDALHMLYKTLHDNEIIEMIYRHDSPYIDHEKYFQQYLEIMKKFEKIEDMEELMNKNML